jgi:hypothetical protein
VVYERAETAITVTTENQVALVLAVGRSARLGLAMQGRGPMPDAAVPGSDAYRATAQNFSAHFLGILAEVHSIMGQPEAELTARELGPGRDNRRTQASCLSSRASCFACEVPCTCGIDRRRMLAGLDITCRQQRSPSCAP